VEYAHGGTDPIATLNDANETPVDCSVDSNSGNLAAANGCVDGSCDGTVAIYLNAQGMPTQYATVPVYVPDAVTYDPAGDILVVGYIGVYSRELVWLPKGGSNFEQFQTQPKSRYPLAVRWDGKNLVVHKAFVAFNRYKISRGIGIYIGHVLVNNCTCEGTSFWIQGTTLIAPASSSTVSFWNYPAGGNPIKTITGLDTPEGVTVSVAQPGSRIHK
jgi:hypothetical protein